MNNTNANFNAKFGIFVGLYNKLNGTTISVADALQCQAMLDAFAITSASLQSNSTTQLVQSQAKSAGSTKKLSYEAFQKDYGSSVAYKIYTHMKKTNTKMSRAEIADSMGIRLSTVCGQINAMVKAGLVQVTGKKIDKASKREVEVLIWK